MIHLLKRIIKKILRRPVDDREMTLVEWMKECGAVIGEDVELIQCLVNPKDASCITIGNHVTCSYVHFLTHDACLRKFIGSNTNRIGNIVIGDYVFIGLHSIIMPNVHIGNNVIIGAGSVVTKDIPDNSVAVGNPARVICSCESFLQRHLTNIQEHPEIVYTDFDRCSAAKDPEKIARFRAEIDGKIVYIQTSNQPPLVPKIFETIE